MTDPGDPEPDWPTLSDQATKENDAAWAAWQEVHEAWSVRLARYLETEGGASRKADLERRTKLAEQLVEPPSGVPASPASSAAAPDSFAAPKHSMRGTGRSA